MYILFPGITQEDFDYFFECLEACKVQDDKRVNFNYPYFAPGAAYGQGWWQLDTSLALSGYKWQDRKFAETSLLNFIEVQKEDGRIALYGNDLLPEVVSGGDVPRQRHEVSSLPKLFDVTYHILKGSSDHRLKEAGYTMLKRYADWWFANRLDTKTGLITAVFEETFIPYLGCAGEYAAVDTNTEVYVGCHYAELLATELKKTADSALLHQRKEMLKNSMNTYLWDEQKGAYYPYDIREGKRIDRLMASTFFPLRLGIASPAQRARLITLLKDHKHFNWDTIPLTSVSKLDDIFTTTEGEYQGNASWSGNVWTLINEMVVRGLVDSGEDALAAELALKTVRAFNHNCAEFIHPFDGKGHGVIQYAWTASQCIEMLVETIFGISYDCCKNEIRIFPKLSDELRNCRLELNDIHISETIVLDVVIDHGTVLYSVSTDDVKVVT